MKKYNWEKGSAQFNIIMIIVIIAVAGGTYLAFNAYQANQEKLAHEEAMRKEEARKKSEEARIENERKKLAAENELKKQTFDSAITFARANQDKPQEAIRKLNEAAEQLKGTEYEALVNIELSNLKTTIAENSEERKKELTAKLTELEKEAAAFAEKKQFFKAISLLKEYDGNLKNETESKRNELALHYEKLQNEYSKQAQAAQKKIAEITTAITEGKLQEASEKLETASLNKSLDLYKEETEALKKSLDTAKNSDKALQSYFESKMNTEITIQTGNKLNFTGTVSAVTKTAVELKIKMGKALAAKKIPFATITNEEKMRILKEVDETASNLVRYATAIKKGDMKTVQDCNFSSTGVFGQHLSRQVQEKISALQEKDNAEKNKESSKPKDAKAKSEDEEDAAKPAIDSKILRALKVKAIVQKPTSSSGSDYDNRFQIIKSRISISNESLGDVSGLEGTIYIIGKSVSGSKDYRLFKIAKTSDISVEKGKKYTSDETSCKVEYDSNDDMKFGYKYEGYLLVLKDSSGVVIMKKGSSAKFEKAADNIVKLEENSIFDGDGKFVEMYRYSY